MSVVIAGNIKRQKDRIDINGNTIDPDTKQVILPAETDYKVSPQDLQAAAAKKPPTEDELRAAREDIKQGKVETAPVRASGNPLGDMIKNEINKAIADAIKEMDISKMVSEAIKDAFK